MKCKSPLLILSALIVLTMSSLAQVNDPVIMTISGNPILKSEFEYIYNKNNSNSSLDKKTLEEYVDLFVNFKLKVEAAKAQGIDTTKSFLNELNGYRSQLTKPYLTDVKVEEALLREAYDRSKEDIEVSHILIRIPQNATPADTLKAWNDINAAWKRIQKEDFTKVAKEISQDQSANETGGYIGWISAFRTIYSFENVAYNTSVGSVSRPIRTSYGYHIIKVNTRKPSAGEVLVAHIMRFTSNNAKNSDSTNVRAKVVIDSLYQRIKVGDDFGTLAGKYSMDKGSSVKNGELPWFGAGRMVPEFETAAFALKNKGDISKPIQSSYGWHIIKLIDKKGIAPFEEIKADLERKIKADERASRGEQAFLEKSRMENNFKQNEAVIQDFSKLFAKNLLTFQEFIAEISNQNKQLCNFATKNYALSDFAKYLKKNNPGEKTSISGILNEFKAFVDMELMAYEDTQLENKYEDFRNLMREYHDGILLFEVSNREVWDKASKDSKGLDKFYKEHKDAYKWDKPHYKGFVVQCKDQKSLDAAKLIIKKYASDSVEKYIRIRLNDKAQLVKAERGIWATGENKIIDNQIFKTNDKYTQDTAFPFLYVDGKLQQKPEDYTDVRGLVTADYQEYLEQEWIKLLRAKYPVKVDENVLKTVKKN